MMYDDVITDAYLSRPMRVRPTFDELLCVYENNSAKVKIPLHPALITSESRALM